MRRRARTWVTFAALSALLAMAPVAAAQPTRIGSLTFDAGENVANAVAVDPSGAFAYVGLDVSFPSKVVKVRTSDMTKVATLDIAGVNSVMALIMDPDGSHVYAAHNMTPGVITRIRLSDFSADGSLTLETGDQQPWAGAITADGSLAYVATATSPARVVRIDLATFTRTGAADFLSGEGFVKSLAISPDGGALFAGTYTSPGRIVRVSTATMSRTGATSLPSTPFSQNNASGVLVSPDGQRVYAGSSRGVVYRHNGADLGSQAALTGATTGTGNWMGGAAISPDGTTAWYVPTAVGGSTSVFPVNLAAGAVGTGVPLPSGEDTIYASALDVVGRFMYLGAGTSPGKLIKVQVSQPQLLTITREGRGTVTDDRSLLTCGSDCEQHFVDGTRVTLTATPAVGSRLTGWGGACSGTATTCTVTMSDARTVTVTFAALPSSAVTPLSAARAAGTVDVSKPRFARKRGRIAMTTTATVSGAGILTQRAVAKAAGRQTTLCAVRATATAAGSRTLTCRFGTAATRAASTKRLRATVTTTFTPTGGDAVTKTQIVRVPRAAGARR